MSKLFRQIKKSISETLKKAQDAVAEETAKAQLQNLQKRLERGIGSNDQRMAFLTAAYAKRVGKGRVRRLDRTGYMRSHIVVRKIRDGYKITFSSAKAARLARYNEQRHKWWGVSKKDRRTMLKVSNQLIKRLFR